MHSCNPYFWEVFKKCVYGLRTESYAQALDDWGNACRSFGLDTTLLDIGMAESKGNVPISGYYDGLYGQKRWAPTAMISLGIGQGELLTPLQWPFRIRLWPTGPKCVLPLADTSNWKRLLSTPPAIQRAMPISWRDYEAVLMVRLAVIERQQRAARFRVFLLEGRQVR